MKKSQRYLVLFILVTTVILLILFAVTNFTQKEIILANDIKEEVLAEMEKYKEYEERTLAWAEEQVGMHTEHLDIGYLSPPDEKNSGGGDPKLMPIKYLIAGVSANNINIFLSSFHPETVMLDLENIQFSEGIQTLEEIMEQISRDKRLEGIHIEEVKGIFNAPTNEIDLTLIYTDDVEVTIRVELASFKDEHVNENFYVITTSMWEIIEQIKTAL